ncbi:hypothetical protein D7D52_28800 [Nocardia yunnanensis]|uniref:DUF6968 domain-containing protein n=1 Tax=Nocardia yunnanensis TaxID=2382165 RepID=A0A386ZIU0_9NOCA|nr:hypothetical protein [Nocardia yunnanensis]AYF77153.1 hypothetical protein D7D52_28800 [Nocardia yunnanensis]
MTEPLIDFKRDVGPFGDPVATRELTSEVHGGPVIVAVGKPRPHPSLERTWFCPWRIEGIEDQPISGSPGVGIDGWQALDAAMEIAGAALQGSGHPVNFHGGPPGIRGMSSD